MISNAVRLWDELQSVELVPSWVSVCRVSRPVAAERPFAERKGTMFASAASSV